MSAQSLEAFSEFEELYEHAPCGLLSTTPDGLITRANETFLERIGFSLDALIGKSFGELCDTGSRMFYEVRYQNVVRLRGMAMEVALTLVAADGSLLPVLINAVSAGDASSVRIAVFEATERQDYERELLNARRLAEASESRVRVLQDASSSFGMAESEESLAAALVASARAAFSATSAAVLLLDDGGELHLAAGTHALGGPVSGRRPEVEALAVGRVIAIANTADATDRYPGTVEALLDARVEALTVTPLMGGSEPLGVLVCFFGRRRQFDDHTIELHEALARQATQVLGRIRLQRQLEYNALHDLLTGLAGRQLLRQRLNQAIASANGSGRSMAMVFLDLDGFKGVNDNQGHVVGDSVLREVAVRLRAGVRQGDIIGRFGGDEFVIICEDAGEEDAAQITERIRRAVREPFDAVRADCPVTASIGVALYQPSVGSTMASDQLLRIADDAMYRSKALGKDGVTIVRA